MRYEILGSLRIVDDSGASFVVRSRRLEAVLSTLLIQHGTVVSIDQLIGEIWGDRPPRRATEAVYVYISQVRKLVRQSESDEDVIVTQFPGYQLRLNRHKTDVQAFMWLMEQGRTRMAVGDYEQAARRFEAALGMCRGAVLGGLHDGPIIRGFASWLEQARLECVEYVVSARLATDRHNEVIGLLYSQIDSYPLHEVFYEQLMRALYRSGRRAEALQVYQNARATLRAELGIDPCVALGQMQSTILHNDDEVFAPRQMELAGR